jgi:hypothetical protein
MNGRGPFQWAQAPKIVRSFICKRVSGELARSIQAQRFQTMADISSNTLRFRDIRCDQKISVTKDGNI